MKVNSSRPKEAIKVFLQRIRLQYLAQKDINRFSKFAAFSVFDGTYQQVCSRIIYNVHAIEKGLSRGKDIRLGFGKKALSTLNDALVVYIRKGYPPGTFAYIQGRSIIHRYCEVHLAAGYDVGFLSEFVDPRFLEAGGKDDFIAAGTTVVRASDKQKNREKGFFDLCQNRFSVREFSGEPIDISKVHAALANASKTPSVCNRQGWKAYVVTHPSRMEKILHFQRGFKGYPRLPECVLVISVSNSTFLSPVERNEAFVDGGLFAMTVIYGLEYEGLAAVPLNAMMNATDEKNIRALAKIDESEQVVMFIAVGAYKEETLVPVSDRKPLSDYMVHLAD